MKKTALILLAGLSAGWFATATMLAQQTNDSATATSDQASPPADQTNAPAAPVIDTSAPPAVGANSAATAGTAENGLRLNFRGVPVDVVLNYLSEAAGFTVIRQTDTKAAGSVDVVSEKLLTKEEAITLLNKVLANNGLAVGQEGNVLTVMTLDAATVVSPIVPYQGDPNSIPRDQKVVTEIVPIHSLNPTQVSKDLLQLRPPGLEMTPNDGGNALILTGHQADIRRFVEIIHALDTSTVGDLYVKMLKFADSKAIAQELKDLFTPDSSAQNFNPFGGGGRGGRGGGGMFGMMGAATDTPSDSKRAPVKVNTVSDDQNNAIIVSAPIDYMPGISNLIEQLDIVQEDTVQIKVFGLKHADPNDVVNELSTLFPDPNQTANQGNQRRGVATFGGFGGFGGGAQNAGANKSDRIKKQTTVVSVQDARTQSVIVTASRDTMVQIEAMIEGLDASAAREMKIHVYQPLYADVLDLQGPLSDLFAGTSGKSPSTTTSQNALAQRAQQAAQQSTYSASGSTSSGSGGVGNTSGR